MSSFIMGLYLIIFSAIVMFYDIKWFITDILPELEEGDF